ncbi:MAG: glucose 1-dehydrogenase [Pseudomonadota bacterium]
MGRLQGKRALVTGAGQGIGAAIATLLANEGATVWVTDLNPDAAANTATAISDAGGTAHTAKLDVASSDDWQAVAESYAQTNDALEVLVHNAGMEWVVPYEDITLTDWQRVMAVNVDSVFIGTQRFLDHLKAAGAKDEPGASIVNISSIAGQIGYSNQVAYNTSKAAVRHLTKSMAIEFAEHGYNIRVNSVHPGCVDTPMLREAMAGWAEAGAFGTTDTAEVRKQVAALHPLNKIARPEDIGYGVVYLASDEARFVTGSELTIDGGWIAR